MKQKKSEYAAFADLLGRVARVPHDEVKAKLEAEKRAKAKKRKRASRASGASSRENA